MEAEFRRLKGVVSTQVGYTGGTVPQATYRQVCGGRTGHAEAVEVEFDPQVIGYARLLEVFFESHDPTSRDRQGPDVGSQYRSAVFYHSEEQKREVLAAKERLEKSGRLRRPIATQIAPATTFWRAEEYHQQYHEKNGLAGCPAG